MVSCERALADKKAKKKAKKYSPLQEEMIFETSPGFIE
jgi:hypothetical protein